MAKKIETETKQIEQSVENFLNNIADENVRADCEKISVMMEKATGAKPKMRGDSIIGFGNVRLKYESGREVDWFELGFSPRKTNITLYLSNGEDWDEQFLAKLGKYKLGKGCLSIKRMSDIDDKVLEDLLVQILDKRSK